MHDEIIFDATHSDQHHGRAEGREKHRLRETHSQRARRKSKV